jgi:hypothetical protein
MQPGAISVWQAIAQAIFVALLALLLVKLLNRPRGK